MPSYYYTLSDIEKINRFVKLPDDGILCDLMWSDPADTNELWKMNSRGISYTYDPEAISIFLKNNKLQLLCRAHQLVPEGFKFFSNNKLITIFSAPNYCGNCGNDGAVMKVSKDLVCSFVIIFVLPYSPFPVLTILHPYLWAINWAP